jgi:hypothetical protein
MDTAQGTALVVDIGPWIFGKKVMLPAGVVSAIDVDDAAIKVDRTKDEIRARRTRRRAAERRRLPRRADATLRIDQLPRLEPESVHMDAEPFVRAVEDVEPHSEKDAPRAARRGPRVLHIPSRDRSRGSTVPGVERHAR